MNIRGRAGNELAACKTALAAPEITNPGALAGATGAYHKAVSFPESYTGGDQTASLPNAMTIIFMPGGDDGLPAMDMDRQAA